MAAAREVCIANTDMLHAKRDVDYLLHYSSIIETGFTPFKPAVMPLFSVAVCNSGKPAGNVITYASGKG